MDMIDILNKCHTDPRFINNNYLTFLFITLKVQHFQPFFKKYSFHIFVILFFEVPTWSTYIHTYYSSQKGSFRIKIKLIHSMMYNTSRAYEQHVVTKTRNDLQ